jgi:hypothetical protein
MPVWFLICSAVLALPGAVLAARDLVRRSRREAFVYVLCLSEPGTMAASPAGLRNDQDNDDWKRGEMETGTEGDVPSATDPDRLRCTGRWDRTDSENGRVTLTVAEDALDRMRAGEPLLVAEPQAKRLGLGAELVVRVERP